ncbi:MAG: hypothetical protein H6705_01070 [Myxococcales bacterium]|nr:hypothetical protein [Myxococcales bacterium]
MNDKQRFGEILVRADVLDRATLDATLAEIGDGAVDLGEVLVARGLIDEQVMLQAVSKALNLPTVGLLQARPDEQALALVPRAQCVEHLVIPIEVERSRTGEHLHLAMANPADVRAIKTVTRQARRRIRPLLASARSIRAAIERFYGAAPAAPAVGAASPAASGYGAPANPAANPASGYGAPTASAANPAAISYGAPANPAPSGHGTPPATPPPWRALGHSQSAETGQPAGFGPPGPHGQPQVPPPLGHPSSPRIAPPAPASRPSGALPPPPIRRSTPDLTEVMSTADRRPASPRTTTALQRGIDADLLDALDHSALESVTGPGDGSLSGLNRGNEYGLVRRPRRTRPRDSSPDIALPAMPGPGPLPPLPPGLSDRRRRPERTTNRPEPRGRPGTSPPPRPIPTSRHAGEQFEDEAPTPLGVIDDRAEGDRVDVRRLLDRFVADAQDETGGADEVVSAWLDRYGRDPGQTGERRFAALEQALADTRAPTARLLVALARHLARRGLVDLDELIAALDA